jgi:hypothetical protein
MLLQPKLQKTGKTNTADSCAIELVNSYFNPIAPFSTKYKRLLV